MLGNNFIKVNGEKLPNPRAMKWSNNPRETVQTSEAGTDIILPKRLDKRSATFTFQTTDRWRRKLEELCAEPTVILEYEGVSRQGRLRYNDATLLSGSEYVAGTNGLYTVKITFTEI